MIRECGSASKSERRGFLKLSALTASAAALAGCRSALSGGQSLQKATLTPTVPATPPPTTAPTETALPSEPAVIDTTGRVVLVVADDRSTGIRRALDLWDQNTIKGKSLFLKPNFNSADPFPGSTHTDTLNTLVDGFYSMGAEHITLGDRSGMGNTRLVMQAKDVFRLADERNLSALVFDELGAQDWERIRFEGSHWANGFAVPKALLAADGIVQTCCLKTHRYGGHFTLSLKNSVGLAAKRVPGDAYDYMTELHNSADQRSMIAEINLAYQPDLVILDGMEAFVDGGPARGRKVTPGVILVGTDRVAIDAIGVAILRYFGTTAEVSEGPVFDQEQIARAVQLGLGVNRPEGIELITGDASSAEFGKSLQDLLV